MARADVIVVGLGAAGAAAAHHLAERGVAVLGIDRFSPPHALGSSHGDTRITRQAIGEGQAYVPLVLRSHQLWRGLEQKTGSSLFTVCGALVVGSAQQPGELHGKRDFVARTIAAARAFDIEHDVLPTAELSARFPQLLGLTDEVGYLEPGGGLLHPERCIAAQLHMAEQLGAALRRNERVLEVVPQRDGVTVVTDTDRHVAGSVVVAAGAWLPELLGETWARTLFSVYPQTMPWFDIAGLFERYSVDSFPAFVWALPQSGVMYGAPAVDGADGGMKVAVEQFVVATTADSIDRAVSPREIERMHSAHVRDRLAGVGPKVVKAEVCMYTCTPDFEFVIDRHPRSDRVLLVSACSGHGFKHSPAVGEAVSQLVLDGRTAIDITSFSIAARTSSPPPGG